MAPPTSEVIIKRLTLATGVLAVALSTLAPALASGEETAVPANRDDVPILTEAQVADLTAPGRIYDSEEVALADAAFMQRWGGVRPETLGRPIQDMCLQFPDSCGGLYYNAESLTYVLLTVPTSKAVADLSQRARQVYDQVAARSNLKLQVKDSTLSLARADQLVSEVSSPARWRPALKATGVQPEQIAAGYDPRTQTVSVTTVAKFIDGVRAAFGSEVSVSVADKGMVPHEDRRNDTPTNGWNAGMALCAFSANQGCPGANAFNAQCTLGLAWIRNGLRMTTTAGHCFQGAPADTNVFRWGPTKIAVGSPRTAEFIVQDNRGDVALMRNTHLDTQYRYNNKMWIGAAQNTNPAERTISGSDITPTTGQNVLLSGANTGSQFGQIDSITAQNNACGGVTDPSTGVFYPFTAGVRLTGFLGNTNFGDSGAPMTTPNAGTTDPDDYLAMGVFNCENGMTSVTQIANQFGGFAANY